MDFDYLWILISIVKCWDFLQECVGATLQISDFTPGCGNSIAAKDGIILAAVMQNGNSTQQKRCMFFKNRTGESH